MYFLWFIVIERKQALKRRKKKKITKAKMKKKNLFSKFIYCDKDQYDDCITDNILVKK